MSESPLSDIDFKIKMTWIWTALKIGNKFASDGKFILSTLLAFCHLKDTFIRICCRRTKIKTLAPFFEFPKNWADFSFVAK